MKNTPLNNHQPKTRGPAYILTVLMAFCMALLSSSQVASASWGKITTGDSPSVNAVVDFGAPNGGVNDAWPALQAALDYLATYPKAFKQNAGVALYLPKGTYRISKRLRFTPKATPYEQGIVIRGEGGYGTPASNNSTIIKFDPVAGELDRGGILFDFSGTTKKKTIQIEDLQFQTTAPNSGPAIEIVRPDPARPDNPHDVYLSDGSTLKYPKPAPSATPAPPDSITITSPLNVTPILRSVNIGGNATAFFNYGLKGSRLVQARMSSVTMTGNPMVTGANGTIACFNMVNSYGSLTEDCNLSGAQYGIWASFTSEGNAVIRSSITNVDYAYDASVVSGYVPGPSGAGAMLLHNTISARKRGITMENKDQFTIANNTFTKESGGASDYVNIQLTDCSAGIIADNQFASGGDTYQTGIKIINDGGVSVLFNDSKTTGSKPRNNSWPDHMTIADNFFGGCHPAVYTVGICANTHILYNGPSILVEQHDMPGAGDLTISNGAQRPLRFCPASIPSYPTTANSTTFNWTTMANSVGPNNIINVMSFGANGTGVDDDTAAINLAIGAVNQKLAGASPAALYFPAGIYSVGSMNSIISGAGTGKLVIYGDGVAASQIRFSSNATTGIKATFATQQREVAIHNLGIIADAAAIPSAISLSMPPGTINANVPRSLLMYDVNISQNTPNTGYFKTWVSGTGLVNPLLRHVGVTMISNFYDGTVARETTGVKLSGGYGFECDYTAVLGGASTGFDIATSPGNSSATGDVLIRGMALTGPYNGMIISSNRTKVEAEGTHINCTSVSMGISNASEVQFVKSYTLNTDFSTNGTTHPDRASLRLSNCSNSHVLDSMFVNAVVGGTDKNGVTTTLNTQRTSLYLFGGSNSNAVTEIDGNMFNEPGTGIFIGQGNTALTIKDSRFMTGVTTPITNNAESATTYSPAKATQIIKEN